MSKPVKATKPVAKAKIFGNGMLLTESSPFHVRESFKTIRTNLLFTLATQNSKVVVVSSAMPNEGKSTTSSNLALVMAQTGARVLLMDCDLRKPTVHRVFRLPIDRGVTSLLCGIDDYSTAIQKEIAPHLDVMTAGPMSPNPSELLGSTQMVDMLEELRKRYDYVIIDVSPINIVSDAIIVAKQTAGIVMVVRQNQSRHDYIRKAVDSCQFAGVNILGMVINESRESKSRYYGYRYGEYGDNKHSR